MSMFARVANIRLEHAMCLPAPGEEGEYLGEGSTLASLASWFWRGLTTEAKPGARTHSGGVNPRGLPTPSLPEAARRGVHERDGSHRFLCCARAPHGHSLLDQSRFCWLQNASASRQTLCLARRPSPISRRQATLICEGEWPVCWVGCEIGHVESKVESKTSRRPNDAERQNMFNGATTSNLAGMGLPLVALSRTRAWCAACLWRLGLAQELQNEWLVDSWGRE